MIEYYNDILCIEVRWLAGTRESKQGEILTYWQYLDYSKRGKIEVVRQGKGKGRTALVSYESLPDWVKEAIIKRLGKSPYELYQYHWFEEYLRPDRKAFDYFSTYEIGGGKYLPPEYARRYSTQAMFLNAITRLKREKKHLSRRKINGERFDFWARASELVNHLDHKYRHKLPSKPGRLRNKHKKYEKYGYDALISRKFSNTNRLKVTPDIERFVISLYVSDKLPFAKNVWEKYLAFLRGEFDLVDLDTGEIFDRQMFYKDGAPIEISISTIDNILNAPQNQDLIKSKRMDYSKYKLNASPYVRRHLPKYTLSKISIDDLQVGKSKDGQPVWAYIAYEPVSQAIFSYVFGRDKEGIMKEFFQELYRSIKRHNLKWPGEIEHEHHLMDAWEDKLDRIFAFRRICNPSNSREKRAEHGIKGYKYGAKKEVVDNVGRWWAKGVYRNKENFKETRNFDDIVADEIKAFDLHNNSKHPLYPDKTRWQVLVENQNPELSKPVDFRIVKEFGNITKTTIRQSDFVRVQYADYWIDPDKLHLLKPYHNDVDAYWIADNDGIIRDIYIYQGDTFICAGELIEAFNEAQIEQTDEDRAKMLRQQKRLAKHRKRLREQREEKVFKPELIPVEISNEMETADVVVHESKSANEWEVFDGTDYYSDDAIDSL